MSLNHSELLLNTECSWNILQAVVVAHACNSSTWEAEAGRFPSSRPAWSTEWVPGQTGLHRKTLFRKTKQNKTKQKKKRKRNILEFRQHKKLKSIMKLSLNTKLKGIMKLSLNTSDQLKCA